MPAIYSQVAENAVALREKKTLTVKSGRRRHGRSPSRSRPAPKYVYDHDIRRADRRPQENPARFQPVPLTRLVVTAFQTPNTGNSSRKENSLLKPRKKKRATLGLGDFSIDQSLHLSIFGAASLRKPAKPRSVHLPKSLRRCRPSAEKTNSKNYKDPAVRRNRPSGVVSVLLNTGNVPTVDSVPRAKPFLPPSNERPAPRSTSRTATASVLHPL